MAQSVPIEGDDYDLIVALAKQLGMSSNCAIRHLARRGILATRGQIYRIWANEGISVRAFRNGKTKEARASIHRVISAPAIRLVKPTRRVAMG